MTEHALCVISTRPPYRGLHAKEALDTVLMAASYEIPTSLLLMGDGVYQLLDNQSPEWLPRKNLLATISSLELYGVETIYVDRDSLDERGIDPAQLMPVYTLLEGDGVAAFLTTQDKVLTF